jgi:transposase
VEVIHPRCAGMDVSKRDAKVCIRIAGKDRRGAQQTIMTWPVGSAPAIASGGCLDSEAV